MYSVCYDMAGCAGSAVQCMLLQHGLLLMRSPGLQVIELRQHVAALTDDLLMRMLLLLILRLNLHCCSAAVIVHRTALVQSEYSPEPAEQYCMRAYYGSMIACLLGSIFRGIRCFHSHQSGSQASAASSL